MVLTWKIPIERRNAVNHDLVVLADRVMPLLGLDQSEYRIRENRIEGTPSAITFKHWISPMRMSVYDITIVPEPSDGFVVMKFRLYKLFVIALIIPLFEIIIINERNLLIPGMVFLGTLILFGGMSLLEIRASRKDVFDIVKAWGMKE